MKTTKKSPLDQYIELKAKHPQCLLLFKRGDFYELFHEDARTAAKALGLTVTTMSKRGETLDPVPMCGFPHYMLEGCLKSLVKLGFRVAICEQST